MTGTQGLDFLHRDRQDEIVQGTKRLRDVVGEAERQTNRSCADGDVKHANTSRPDWETTQSLE